MTQIQRNVLQTKKQWIFHGHINVREIKISRMRHKSTIRSKCENQQRVDY